VAELASHGVERLAEPAQLIAPHHRNHLIQVSKADGLGRLRYRLNRLQQRLDIAPGQPARRQRRPDQANSETDQGVSRRQPRSPAGIFHVFLIEIQDFVRNILDVLEGVFQAFASLLSEVIPVAFLPGGVCEEGVSLLAVASLQFFQLVHKLPFSRNGDIAFLLCQPGVERRPVLLVLPAGLGLAAGQGELKGRVDPLQVLLQTLHVDDAVVVFAQDGIDVAPQAQQQHHPRSPQDRHQGQQR